MIKITNNVNTMEVTVGAYQKIYKNLGFTVVEEKSVSRETSPDKNDGKQKSEEELYVEQLLEKPISEWNKGEVKKFAEINEIDISNTKNAGEAKDIINAWLEENE